MPFSSGVFSLVAGNPVVTGTTISSTWANNTLDDIADNGLSLCLLKDGTQTPTANIPLGGFRLTGVGPATALTDAPIASQVQNNAFNMLSSVSGVTTITGAATPTPSAYADGQRFSFIAVGVNAASPTLNVSSLGALPIFIDGSTATSSQWRAKDVIDVVYISTSSATGFHVQSGLPSIGGLVRIRVLTSSQTWVRPSGLKRIKVTAVGGGAGGGGCDTTSPPAGAGGGGGATTISVFEFAALSTASASVVVGSGGPGGSSAGATGSNGFTSNFSGVMPAGGGIGGGGSTGSIALGGEGGTASGGNLMNIAGGFGLPSYGISSGYGGYGGASQFGVGAPGGTGVDGQDGRNYGGGGGGAGGVGDGKSGGDGAPGVVIIEEYY